MPVDKLQARYEAAVADLGFASGSLEAQLLWDYTRAVEELLGQSHSDPAEATGDVTDAEIAAVEQLARDALAAARTHGASTAPIVRWFQWKDNRGVAVFLELLSRHRASTLALMQLREWLKSRYNNTDDFTRDERGAYGRAISKLDLLALVCGRESHGAQSLTGALEMNEPLDLDDPQCVLEFAHEAAERGDDNAVAAMLERAISEKERITVQRVVNVLSATNWAGQQNLNAMLGWRDAEPSEKTRKLREQFAALAAKWMFQHEPERGLRLLQGLIPESSQ